MKHTTITAALMSLIASATIGLPALASAAPTGAGSAADTVKTLQDMGYAVQLNGAQTAPLSQCRVTGVHGLVATDPMGHRADPLGFDTAYVDVDCPSDS
jgi:hypothetical protein